MKTTCRWAMCGVILLAITPFVQLRAQQDRVVSDDDMNVVEFEDMKYPAIGRTARLQGIVVVKVKLDDHGRVVEATAISGKQVLIADCIANAKKWRFRPNAEKEAVIVYNFRLSGGISKSGCDHSMLEAPNLVTVTTCPIEIQ